MIGSIVGSPYSYSGAVGVVWKGGMGANAPNTGWGKIVFNILFKFLIKCL